MGGGGGERARLRTLVGVGGGGARLRMLVGGGGKGEPNFSQDVNWSKSSPPPTTSRLHSVPNNDISHNKTDHIAKLRIELKSILLAKSLNWYICDLVFTVSRRHWRKMWVDCLGGGGRMGRKGYVGPLRKLLGDLAPPSSSPPPPRSYAYVNLKLQRRIRYFKFEWSCWNDNKYCDKTLDAQVDPHLCIWRESARALTHVWKQIISKICHKEKKNRRW